MSDYTPFDEVNDLLDPSTPIKTQLKPQIAAQKGRHEVFRLRAYDGELLYVTRSPQLHQLKKKDWWSEVANISIERFNTPGQAEDAKLVAVDRESPKYNVRTTM